MYEYDTRVHCFRQAGKMFILRGHGKALVVFSFPWSLYAGFCLSLFKSMLIMHTGSICLSMTIFCLSPFFSMAIYILTWHYFLTFCA